MPFGLDREMFSEEQWEAILEQDEKENSMNHPMLQSSYVKSRFPRKLDDDYQTVDPRCVQALIETLPLSKTQLIVDPCAPGGSGIVTGLLNLGYMAVGNSDVFAPYCYRDTYIVTNPPYKREKVGPIMRELISKIEPDDGAIMLCVLLRTGFDHGRIYADMFDHPAYAGQLKLRFRPWWSEDHSIAPIHNFAWHIWSKRAVCPNVWYWPIGVKSK